jgi:HEAT repeat protein
VENSFTQLLDSLGGQQLARSRLTELSDLDSEALQQFEVRWKELDSSARQSLLEDLGLLADSQIELDFEAINRVALKDPDRIVRTQAIENLWECEDPTLAEPLLLALREDSSTQVREAAAKALGAFVLLGETQSLPAAIVESIEDGLLYAAEHDPDQSVRDRVLESLGYSSRSEVPSLVLEAYQAEDDSRLPIALRAMGRSANRRWSPEVLARLHHPDPEVREKAARAAGEIDAREATEELIDLLDDANDQVRRAAIWSLGQLGGSLASEALGALAESDTDEAESLLLQDALDYMVFMEGTRDLLRRSEHDGEDLSH